MITYSGSERYAQPPEAVFDLLADIANEPGWNPDCYEITVTPPGPVAAGTTFRGRFKNAGWMDGEVTVFERATRLADRFDGSRLKGEMEWRFSPDGPGTRLDLSVRIEPVGVMKLAAPMLRIMIPRMYRARFGQWRAALER
jgi:uncharacterized protein YndB with AHSA1/START domain